jgi:dimethylglycine oxidase
VVGYVTSAGYGYGIGRCIAYAYVPVELAAPGTSLEIEYLDRRQAATVATEPLFDPKGERLKG